jgi:transposase
MSLAENADFEWLQIDATIIRAHKHTAGAPLIKGGSASQGLGRSKGGYSTKLHAVTDGLGLPIPFLAGPGQVNDMKQAGDLIAGFHPNNVMADRAYDADSLTDAILDASAEPVIPPRRHRRCQHYYDKDLYKARNQIERFSGKLKKFRHIATRYDKLLQNFLGFVKIAAIAIWLR